MLSVEKKTVRGQAAVFFVSSYWGITSVLMKHVLSFTDSFTYIFLRFLLAGIVILLVCGKKIFLSSRRSVFRGLVMGLMSTATMEATVFGLNFTMSSNSVFLSQLTVIIVPVLVCISHRQRPPARLVLSVTVMLCGVLLLTGSRGGNLNPGDLITIGTAFLNSVAIILFCRLAYSEDPVRLGGLQILFAMFFSGILAGAAGNHRFIVTGWSLWIIFLTGVIGTGLCFILNVVAQKYAGPIAISLLSLNNCIFGMFGAMLIPDLAGNVEIITRRKLISCAFILAGMLIYVLTNNKQINEKKP